jgi:hydrogenase maturation factor
MKKHLFLILTISLLCACKNSTKDDADQIKKQDELLQPYKTVFADDICSIEVPKYFYEIDDINPDALIQYGYIEQEDTVNLNYIEDEIYAIVLVNYKFELEKIYGDSIEITLNDFNQMCQSNLSYMLEDFSAEFESPKIQTIGEVNYVHNEFLGRLDDYLVYYQIGIYETPKGYYQVLTWTLQEYMAKHKDEMLKITTSFNEL